MPPTHQQQQIIDHNPVWNGRVLAGPGTGKSWTSVALTGHLLETYPNLRIRLLTFTRAATQDLAQKLGRANIDIARPSTIHSFALSLLVRNPEAANLPYPLRIPDTWEVQELIRPDLARRLRDRGFDDVTVKTIETLERELAARWQALGRGVQLLAQLEPQVRNAYVGLWESHRRILGYTLLAELPFRAGNALEDFGLDIGPLNFLIVDEYQDLNEADIRLIRLFHQRGVRVFAIGDDDQSIYGFRMAAPEGIQRFPDEFGGCDDYQLTISQRCGEAIVNAATMLIETVPNRPRKPPLTFREGAGPGRFYYLRFDNESEEISGVADLVSVRHRAGVPLSEIAILVRSQVRTWATMLIPALYDRGGITAVDTEWVKTVLQDNEVRTGLARFRIAVNRMDSLAWWTLLRLERGIAQEFPDYVYDIAAHANEKFGETLLRLYPHFPEAPTRQSAGAAARLVSRTLIEAERLNFEDAQLGETGWGGWVIDRLDHARLSDGAIRMFENVGRAVPSELVHL